MAEQVTNYTCPGCGGPLQFEGKSGKMACEYCGNKYTVAEIEEMYAGKNAAAEEAFSAAESGEKGTEDEWEQTTGEWTDPGMKAYSCPSCGAELMVDETTAATSCPYCGNPTVVPGQFKDVLKPEYIIPFKLDKKAAKEALKNHYQGKPFLPKAFTANNHIEEIKGVYVPFWLYSGKAHAIGVYEGLKNSTRKEGDTEIITTEHFNVRRSGDIAFEKIPADASSKMPDSLMDSIEPYNYNELTDFSMAYLPGYLADKYDISAEDDAERAVERAKKSAMQALQSDIKAYDHLNTIKEFTSVKQGKISYAMFPVWLLSTKWNGQNYLFAMNGQTGKLVGDLPTDKGRFWTTFIAIAAVIEVIMAVITFVL